MAGEVVFRPAQQKVLFRAAGLQQVDLDLLQPVIGVGLTISKLLYARLAGFADKILQAEAGQAEHADHADAGNLIFQADAR